MEEIIHTQAPTYNFLRIRNKWHNLYNTPPTQLYLVLPWVLPMALNVKKAFAIIINFPSCAVTTGLTVRWLTECGGSALFPPNGKCAMLGKSLATRNDRYGPNVINIGHAPVETLITCTLSKCSGCHRNRNRLTDQISLWPYGSEREKV